MTRGLRFSDSHLAEQRPGSEPTPVVRTGTLLIDLMQVFARQESRHVLVQDDDGRLAGIVSTTNLQNALRDSSDSPSIAWHHRTVESLLSVTLEEDAVTTTVAGAEETPESRELECLSVREGSSLVALMTHEDVLLSWKRLEPALARAATDALTRLPNRAHFERRVHEEWQRAARLNLTLGLLIIDVDRFKSINDTYGHLRGDMVLAAVAECCQKQLRSYDLVARYGGDEFIALTCGCQASDIDTPIRRLMQATRSLGLTFDGQPVPTSLSIGVAVAGSGLARLSPQDLIHAADQCLYQSKRAGRDQAHCTELGTDGKFRAAVQVGDAAAATQRG